MSEFRTPHAFENIAQALQDAMDPDKPQTIGSAVNLINENARAVEDAINGIDITGLSGGVGYDLDESQVGENTWTLPGTSDTFMANISVSGAVPVGAQLHLLVSDRDTYVVADGGVLETVTSSSMTLYSGPYDLTVFWYLPGDLSNIHLALEFSAIKVG